MAEIERRQRSAASGRELPDHLVGAERPDDRACRSRTLVAPRLPSGDTYENARAPIVSAPSSKGTRGRPAGYPGACLVRYAISTVLAGLTASARTSRRPNAGPSTNRSASIDGMPRIADAEEEHTDVLPMSSRHRCMNRSSSNPSCLDRRLCLPALGSGSEHGGIRPFVTNQNGVDTISKSSPASL